MTTLHLGFLVMVREPYGLPRRLYGIQTGVRLPACDRERSRYRSTTEWDSLGAASIRNRGDREPSMGTGAKPWLRVGMTPPIEWMGLRRRVEAKG